MAQSLLVGVVEQEQSSNLDGINLKEVNVQRKKTTHGSFRPSKRIHQGVKSKSCVHEARLHNSVFVDFFFSFVNTLNTLFSFHSHLLQKVNLQWQRPLFLDLMFEVVFFFEESNALGNNQNKYVSHSRVNNQQV
jgi:hypothetical protein